MQVQQKNPKQQPKYKLKLQLLRGLFALSQNVYIYNFDDTPNKVGN